MRTLFGLWLLAVCLIVAGCKLPSVRPRPDSAPFNPDNRPSSGGGSSSERDSNVEGQTASTNLPPRINGYLSGQILADSARRIPGAQIEIIDLDDPKEKTPLTKSADTQGYFNIKGLQPGHRYMLVARGRDGMRSVEGRTRVVPPNPKVWIYVEESDGTPPKGGEASQGAEQSKPEAKPAEAKPSEAKPAEKSPTPAAKLEAPIKTLPGSSGDASITPARTNPGGKAEVPNKTIREQIGKENASTDEFQKYPTEVGNIPGPGRDSPAPSRAPDATPTIPSPPISNLPDRSPREDSAPEGPQSPPSNVPPLPPAEQMMRNDSPTRAPSCVRVGNRVHNFTLYNLDGDLWELRKNRKRLVLLDFWFAGCVPCMHSIPHLVDLQRKYSSYGFSVVGVAYEKGTPTQQADRVRGVRERLNINYPTLLGSGIDCPVRTQLEVAKFPTAILIDETGMIVWRSEGLDAQKLYDLEMTIRKGLRMPLR